MKKLLIVSLVFGLGSFAKAELNCTAQLFNLKDKSTKPIEKKLVRVNLPSGSPLKAAYSAVIGQYEFGITDLDYTDGALTAMIGKNTSSIDTNASVSTNFFPGKSTQLIWADAEMMKTLSCK